MMSQADRPDNEASEFGMTFVIRTERRLFRSHPKKKKRRSDECRPVSTPEHKLAENRPSFCVPRCFLLQSLLECGSKISAAEVLRSGEDFTTVAIQKQVMRNAGHANKLHQIRLVSCSFVNLWPGNTLALREVNKLFLFPGAIEADSQDFKALLAELCVGRFHIGNFRHTRATPGRPEINQDEFAFVILRKVQPPSVKRGLDKWPHLVAHGEVWQNPLLRDFFSG